MRTSVRSSSSVPSSSASARVAISGRPSPRPGLSVRGTIPRPSSRTTAAAGLAHVGGHLQRAVAVGVGVHDGVGARLGDGELDVRRRLVVDRESLAEPADRVADHRDVLRPGGKRQERSGGRAIPWRRRVEQPRARRGWCRGMPSLSGIHARSVRVTRRRGYAFGSSRDGTPGGWRPAAGGGGHRECAGRGSALLSDSR